MLYTHARAHTHAHTHTQAAAADAAMADDSAGGLYPASLGLTPTVGSLSLSDNPFYLGDSLSNSLMGQSSNPAIASQSIPAHLFSSSLLQQQLGYSLPNNLSGLSSTLAAAIDPPNPNWSTWPGTPAAQPLDQRPLVEDPTTGPTAPRTSRAAPKPKRRGSGGSDLDAPSLLKSANRPKHNHSKVGGAGSVGEGGI